MLVSIVIDNHHDGFFVARAIDSALAQTHAEVEVVVVGAAACEATALPQQGHAAQVRRVTPAEAGQGPAYNAGFANSRGELLVFLDADDWLYPDAAAQIVAAWQPGVSKLQFRLDLVDTQGRPSGRQLPSEMHAGEDAERLVCEFGAYGSPPASGNAYSAAYLRQVLPMDASAWGDAADALPILLAPAHGRVRSLELALGAYRAERAAQLGKVQPVEDGARLQAEYERITAAKRAVIEDLERVRLEYREPLALAPWEVHTLALCRRFGEPALRERLAREGGAGLGYVLGSIWRWPTLSLARKLSVSLWALAVVWLPRPLAGLLARRHRQSGDLPQVA
jgi:hypothetical protein